MTLLIGLLAIVSNPVAVVFYFLFLDAVRFVRYFAEILEVNKSTSPLFLLDMRNGKGHEMRIALGSLPRP